MRISDSGLKFLKKEEGERLVGYLDTRGVPTVGVGHTGTVDGGPVYVGMVITASKSEQLLLQDLAWVEKCIMFRVTVSLNQNQYDALSCFIFNIGATQFARSSMLKLLNSGDYSGAANAMLDWKRAGTDKERLLPRRQRERKLFLS